MWVRRGGRHLARCGRLDQTVDEVFDVDLAVVPPTANDDDGRECAWLKYARRSRGRPCVGTAAVCADRLGERNWSSSRLPSRSIGRPSPALRGGSPFWRRMAHPAVASDVPVTGSESRSIRGCASASRRAALATSGVRIARAAVASDVLVTGSESRERAQASASPQRYSTRRPK